MISERGPALDTSVVDPVLDPAQRLRRAERWLLPASMLVLLAMLGIGWQWVQFSTPPLVRDGRLALVEARYWVRSRELHGLTVAQAQHKIDAPLEPVGDGILAARALIAPPTAPPASPNLSGDRPVWLMLTIEGGRVAGTKIE